MVVFSRCHPEIRTKDDFGFLFWKKGIAVEMELSIARTVGKKNLAGLCE
jgi:hypothetical protein